MDSDVFPIEINNSSGYSLGLKFDPSNNSLVVNDLSDFNLLLKQSLI